MDDYSQKEFAFNLKNLIKKLYIKKEGGDILIQNFDAIKEYLADGASHGYPWYQDSEGRTALHEACIIGHWGLIEHLIEAGHPWNGLDNENKTAAELALENGHSDIYEKLVQHAVRTQLILMKIGQNSNIESESKYLEQKVRYENDMDTLKDEENNGVMMKWEWPLMRRHAQIICQINDIHDIKEPSGKNITRSELHNFKVSSDERNSSSDTSKGSFNVLNIGFGLGIVDSYIEQYLNIRQQIDGIQTVHFIVEPHPDVLSKMNELGWVNELDLLESGQKLDRPILRIIDKPWNEAVADLMNEGVLFDGIFYDTFGEQYENMVEWHENVVNLLKPEKSSVYSFFNGLAGTNRMFHEVYCRIVEIDLADIGLNTEWELMKVETLGSKPPNDPQWNVIKRPYYTLDDYRLPICRFTEI